MSMSTSAYTNGDWAIRVIYSFLLLDHNDLGYYKGKAFANNHVD